MIQTLTGFSGGSCYFFLREELMKGQAKIGKTYQTISHVFTLVTGPSVVSVLDMGKPCPPW